MKNSRSCRTGRDLSSLLTGFAGGCSSLIICFYLIKKCSQMRTRDMQARVSLWASLTGLGWPQPQREPLSKAELIEEERVRQAMLEARQFASAEDLQTPCRTSRVLVGYKAS